MSVEYPDLDFLLAIPEHIALPKQLDLLQSGERLGRVVISCKEEDDFDDIFMASIPWRQLRVKTPDKELLVVTHPETTGNDVRALVSDFVGYRSGLTSHPWGGVGVPFEGKMHDTFAPGAVIHSYPLMLGGLTLSRKCREVSHDEWTHALGERVNPDNIVYVDTPVRIVYQTLRDGLFSYGAPLKGYRYGFYRNVQLFGGCTIYGAIDKNDYLIKAHRYKSWSKAVRKAMRKKEQEIELEIAQQLATESAEMDADAHAQEDALFALAHPNSSMASAMHTGPLSLQGDDFFSSQPSVAASIPPSVASSRSHVLDEDENEE